MFEIMGWSGLTDSSIGRQDLESESIKNVCLCPLSLFSSVKSNTQILAA